MFKFERLEVWQAAIGLADEVYRLSKPFPADERFGLTAQVRRSAVSVSANVAEGSGRVSPRDFMRFVEIAFGSLMETVSHLTVAKRQGMLDAETFGRIYSQAERLGRMLSGLRARLRSDVDA